MPSQPVPRSSEAVEHSLTERATQFAIVGVGLALAYQAVFHGGSEATQHHTVAPIAENSLHPGIVGPNEFGDNAVEKIAEKLHIGSGDWWEPSTACLDAIEKSAGHDGYTEQKTLLPIFPGNVMKHQKAIQDASKEWGVPVNILGSISTIESYGEPTAASNVADGVMQVVPGLHFDKIVAAAQKYGHPIKNADGLLAKWRAGLGRGDNIFELNAVVREAARPALQNPEIGYTVGAQILRADYDAVLKQTNFRPNHPNAWVSAAIAYNGGAGLINTAYGNLPTQSALYGDFTVRFIMTAEMAAQLRNEGMSDQAITKALSSREIDARAYAFLTAHSWLNGSTQSYQAVYAALAEPQLLPFSKDPLMHQLYANYRAYLSGRAQFVETLTPGQRLWLVHTGRKQLK